VAATKRLAPSTTDQSARGIWGESASVWFPAGGTSNGIVIQPSPYTEPDPLAGTAPLAAQTLDHGLSVQKLKAHHQR